jgi:hypothetical protein
MGGIDPNTPLEAPSDPTISALNKAIEVESEAIFLALVTHGTLPPSSLRLPPSSLRLPPSVYLPPSPSLLHLCLSVCVAAFSC